MFHTTRFACAVLCAGAITTIVMAQDPSRPKLPISPKYFEPIRPNLKDLQELLAQPDPAAIAVDFRLVRRTGRFTGQVEIVGTIRNVGTADFISGKGQQGIQLYEEVPGARPRLVASLPFERLNQGAELQIRYTREWNASSPAEGEFPPTYRLQISYDPDIVLDGNPKNDDSNWRNNSRERSGSAINDLLRR